MKLGGFKLWSQEQYRLRKEKWQQLEHRNWSIAATICFVFGLLLLFTYLVVIPDISKETIIKLKQLRNGSHILETWLLQPEPFITRIYIWNLTNADEVVSGISNPHFTQAGPYVFEQVTQKIPIKYKNNSIEYMSRTTYKYRSDLTAPASLDDIVVSLQVALYGAAVEMERLAPTFVSLLDGAAPSLFPGLKSIFAAIRVGDYLFDGVRLRCSSDGPPAAQMVCSALSSRAPPTLRQLPNSTDYAFSFLAHRNFTDQGPFEEDRGKKDIRQLGQITKYKGKSVLDTWKPGSQCDRLRGTDALIYAPFVSKSDTIEIYISDLCQVSPLQYLKTDYVQNLTVYKFGTSRWLESSLTNPDNGCYCTKSNEKYCKINGLRDISDCMEAPVIVSLPHFLNVDEELRKYAAGVNPDPDLHSSELYIEPQTGTPVKAAKRIQFNMELRRIAGFSLVQNISEGIFPLMWLEETILLSEEALRPVTRPLLIQWLANIACVVLIVIMLIAAICSSIVFLYNSRLWCFQNVSNNRVTALFYRARAASTDLTQ